jgi:hypothetical protein
MSEVPLPFCPRQVNIRHPFRSDIDISCGICGKNLPEPEVSDALLTLANDAVTQQMASEDGTPMGEFEDTESESQATPRAQRIDISGRTEIQQADLAQILGNSIPTSISALQRLQGQRVATGSLHITPTVTQRPGSFPKNTTPKKNRADTFHERILQRRTEMKPITDNLPNQAEQSRAYSTTQKNKKTGPMFALNNAGPVTHAKLGRPRSLKGQVSTSTISTSETTIPKPVLTPMIKISVSLWTVPCSCPYEQELEPETFSNLGTATRMFNCISPRLDNCIIQLLIFSLDNITVLMKSNETLRFIYPDAVTLIADKIGHSKIDYSYRESELWFFATACNAKTGVFSPLSMEERDLETVENLFRVPIFEKMKGPAGGAPELTVFLIKQIPTPESKPPTPQIGPESLDTDSVDDDDVQYLGQRACIYDMESYDLGLQSISHKRSYSSSPIPTDKPSSDEMEEMETRKEPEIEGELEDYLPGLKELLNGDKRVVSNTYSYLNLLT